MISQRLAYLALAERLVSVDLDLIVGVPTALHRMPAAYVTSTVVEIAPPRQLVSRLRPTLTLAVPWQEQGAAEFAIVDLVDAVLLSLWSAPLDDVCRCNVETVSYGWRDVSGVTYRVADVSLVLSQL
jgi:hypothetical protein